MIEHWRKEPIALLLVAFIRLSIKYLSCGKEKIFIAAADIKTDLQPKVQYTWESAEICTFWNASLLFLFLLLAESTIVFAFSN